MSYFNYFPRQTNYPIELRDETDSSRRTIHVSFQDLYRQVSLISPKVNDAKFYYNKVDILDGERPDQLSQRLYDTPNYYWTFFILNDTLRFGESLQWPLSNSQLFDKVNRGYTGRVVTVYNNEYEPSKFLFDKFQIGETVTGSISGLSGTIKTIRASYGQILIQDLSSDALEADFKEGETLTGSISGDSVIVDKSINFSDAVYKYYDQEEGREINNANFIDPSNIQTNIGIGPITFRQRLQQINDSLKSIRVLKRASIVPFIDTVRELLKRN